MAGICTHPRLYTLVTCKFDNGMINTKGVIMSATFSLFIYIKKLFSTFCVEMVDINAK